MLRHGLNTSTDTNFDHTGGDGVGNVNASHETRRTLSVKSLDTSADRETSLEGSGTVLGGTGTRGQDVTDGDVLDEFGVDAGSLDDSLEGEGQEVGGGGVLEKTLATLAEGSTKTGGDDDLLWFSCEFLALLLAMVSSWLLHRRGASG